MINSDVLTKVNNKKFKSGIEFQKQLLQLTRDIQDRLLQGLPSNYTKDRNTNLSEFFRAVAKEFARLQVSSSDVNEDKYNEQTRVEYLFQILGDTLFLGEKAINENLNDVAYRDFLLKVRNAYYEGSRKQNLESAISDIVGLPVTIKELYLELRKKNSFYGLKDTHKMFFDILMDDVTSASSIGVILEDLKFFIDIIKPAHTLYDTRLIWNEALINRDGACKPSYVTQPMAYDIYGTSRIYQVTYLASKIYKFAGTDTHETWTEGVIQAIDLVAGIFYLVDNRILVYDSSTKLYIRDLSGDREVLPVMFSVGDVIKYYATKDTSTSSDVIKADWGYTGTVNEVFPNDQFITLNSGAGIVYNRDTLAYTRDKSGEYRVDVEDLQHNREIAFKAEHYTQAFQFYRTPTAVQDDFFRQFDSTIIAKPSFQEYIEKNKEIPAGTQEGYDVVVENGIATVKKIYSKFYKRDNSVSYKNVKINKYSLFIDDVFERQFQIDDPQRMLTQSEAKNVFIAAYGYTGLQDSSTNYRIDIATTGELFQDGPDATVQAIGTQTEMCDRKAACQLMPLYEDTRKYFTWPDLQLTSGFFDVSHDFGPGSGVTGAVDLPAWYYLLSSDPKDPNTYVMPYLPMLGPEGLPATASDITVYVSGRRVADAVQSIDPWNGIVSLNFIPPFDTIVRIDYYFSKRFPNPVFYLKQIISSTVQTATNDLGGTFSVINPGGTVIHLSWPFEVTDPDLYGDDRDYQMNKFPILNNEGKLATKSDINVFLGMPVVSGTLQVTSITASSSVLTDVSGTDLSGVRNGDVIIIQAENYLDNTLIYSISAVNPVAHTLTVPNSLPVLSASYGYTIVQFNKIVDAVEDVRPLLGHVRLNFLPPAGSFLRINYYFTPYQRNYLMLPDAIGETGSLYGSSSYTSDTFYGSRSDYALLVDQSPDYADEPFWNFDELKKIGYRYRAFSLPHSAVLNSEQLLLNDYEQHSNGGSFKNQVGMIGQYDLMFSGEFLNDTDKNVILNDLYLKKDLPAVTVLNPGTPIFAKSFTDDGHHKNAIYADETDTYDPDLLDGRDLPGSFTIIDPDDSGIIDYNPVCAVTDNEQINLYSDLKTVEFSNGGYDAPLSTIDEGGLSLPFKFTFVEQYYPNRELRLVDYLDYINQVPTEHRTGSLRVLNNSTVVKSLEKNFKALNVGDIFTVKDIPYEAEVGYTGYFGFSGTQEFLGYTTGYGETGYEVRRYQDKDYTLVNIVDFETAKIHPNFEDSSGTYEYELTRDKVYAVDVSLQGSYGETSPQYFIGNLNRLLVLNGQIGFSYSIPDSVLQHFPGYGDTGSYTLSFIDPDPDPYPRNPDNPWIPNPTGIAYLTMGYQIEYRYTGGVTGMYYVRSNRINATTGIVRSSQIIDEWGRAGGGTGAYSGYTGPSGALDLGITGPVGDANPRILKPSDSYVIPSGDTGTYLSFSEAEYRVQWRNWDQDMLIVTLGVTGGILIESPINMMDDLGEGIKRSFWNVHTGTLREIRFQGSIVETSERVSATVPASGYPLGLILLTADQVDVINAGSTPAHLNDTYYEFRRRIIREILHDDSIKVTEIQEFVPLP